MATRFELVLDERDGDVARAAADAAFDELRDAEARLSRFRRDSWTSHLVRHAACGPVRVDAELFALLELSEEVRAASRGAFDVSGGTARSVTLDPAARTVHLMGDDVRLDFGAVGKGWALDRMAGVLAELGVRRALLHGGTSTAIALGAPPGRSGWGVAIAGAPGVRVDLRDHALSVSAQRGRSHVRDPRTGAAVDEGCVAAVTAPSAALADAWSTALLVLGDEPTDGPFERIPCSPNFP